MDNFWTRLTTVLHEGYMELVKKKDPDGTFDFIIADVNAKLESMTGMAKNELTGRSLSSLCEDGQWLTIVDLLQRSYSKEKQVMILGQLHFWVQIVPIDENRLALLLLQTMPPRRSTANLHDVLFEYAPDIILYIELDGSIINANQQACKEYGYTKEELCSMKIQMIRHPDYEPVYQSQMELADHNGILFEVMHLRKDGTSFPVEVNAKTVYTRHGKFRVHIIRDITKRKEHEAQIAWLAKYDALTGIANRGSFLMELEKEISRCQRSQASFVLMMFDIDKFKLINDQYGHEAGDVVLQEVATRVHGVLRNTDMIGRLGGDEFVVLQTNVETWDAAAVLANRILAAMTLPITYQNNQLPVQVSIGMCMYPQDASDSNGLLACADKAMYQIKRQRGGFYARFQAKE